MQVFQSSAISAMRRTPRPRISQSISIDTATAETNLRVNCCTAVGWGADQLSEEHVPRPQKLQETLPSRTQLQKPGTGTPKPLGPLWRRAGAFSELLHN